MPHDQSRRFLKTWPFIMASFALSGCISASYVDHGTLRSVGLGAKHTHVTVQGGRMDAVVAWGLSINAHRFAPAITFGHSRIRLLKDDGLPEEDAPGKDAAFLAMETQTTGISLGLSRLDVGRQRQFGVITPMPGDSFVQWVHFNPAQPEETVAMRKEMP